MSQRRLILTAILAIIFIVTLLPMTPCATQGQTGAITGNVTNPSGGVLTGAQASKSTTRPQVTDDEIGECRVNTMLNMAEYGAGGWGET